MTSDKPKLDPIIAAMAAVNARLAPVRVAMARVSRLLRAFTPPAGRLPMAAVMTEYHNQQFRELYGDKF